MKLHQARRPPAVTDLLPRDWPAPLSGETTFSESLTTTDTPSLTDDVPDGTETVTGDNIQSLTRQVDNSAGQVVKSDVYFDASGYTLSSATFGSASNDSSSGNYFETQYAYDADGRQNKVVDPTGTINRTVYDSSGDVISKWIGVNDTPESEYWAPNNAAGMFEVEDDTYDQDPAPASASVTGITGSLTGTFYVEVTYVFGSGSNTSETVASPEATYNASSSGLRVLAPQEVPGETGYNVYIGTAPDTETLQNTAPISSTVNWNQSGSLTTSSQLAQQYGSGDHNLTQVTYHPGGGAADRTTQFVNDWQDRQVVAKAGVLSSLGDESGSGVNRPIVYSAIDNAGETFASYQFDGDGIPLSDFWSTALAGNPSGSNVVPTADGSDVRIVSGSNFDTLGRVTQTTQYAVDQTYGGYPTLGSSAGLVTSYYYDNRSDLIKTLEPGGLDTFSVFDGAGRDVKDTVGEASGTANAFIAVSQTLTQYDGDGNVLLTIDRERFDNDPDSTTGDLAGPGGGDNASRDYYTAYWYNAAGEETDSADFGTNGGYAYTWQSSPPSIITGEISHVSGDSVIAMAAPGPGLGGYLLMITSGVGEGESMLVASSGTGSTFTLAGTLTTTPDVGDTFELLPTALLTHTDYTALGQVADTFSPSTLDQSAIQETANSYNLAGQMTQQTAGPSGGSPIQTTDYTYNGDSQVIVLEAQNSGGDPQYTDYNYGVETSSSAINANNLLGSVSYPNPGTGAADDAASEFYSYDALGETTSYNDRNDNEHHYSYDVLGRKIADVVSTLGSGVDGSVRALGYAYDSAGRLYTATTYSDTSMSTVTSQILNQYNDLGQLVRQYQSNTNVDLLYHPWAEVDYVYSDLADGNNSRLEQMIYPNGRKLDYVYSTDLDNAISRVDELADDSDGSPGAAIVTYKYLGLSTIVQEAQGNGDTLSYISQSGDSDALPTDTATSGGDRYTGLDRFGRVDDQYWFNSSGGTVARYQYTYDQDSNVLTRDDLVNTGASQTYTYDSIDRLTEFKQGTLSDGSISSPTTDETWELDALGNQLTDTLNGTPTMNTFDDQNRETSSTVGITTTDQTYDDNGNLLTGSTGQTYTYDAWNHMITAKVGSITVTYGYDALGQQITSQSSYYTYPYGTIEVYDAAGQAIETDAPGSDEPETGSVTGWMVNQNVWGLGYVNDLVERDDHYQDMETTGATRRLYDVRDANHDVMGITDGSGAVQEWFGYGAYGTQFVFDSSYASTTDGYNWVVGFQGGMTDPTTGLVHFDARSLNTENDRWNSQEIFGSAYVDGENLYQGFDSNPLNRADASGLTPAIIIVLGGQVAQGANVGKVLGPEGAAVAAGATLVAGLAVYGYNQHVLNQAAKLAVAAAIASRTPAQAAAQAAAVAQDRLAAARAKALAGIGASAIAAAKEICQICCAEQGDAGAGGKPPIVDYLRKPESQGPNPEWKWWLIIGGIVGGAFAAYDHFVAHSPSGPVRPPVPLLPPLPPPPAAATSSPATVVPKRN